ncbi:hypothetical protein [Streptomyces chryseus]
MQDTPLNLAARVLAETDPVRRFHAARAAAAGGRCLLRAGCGRGH